ncbi:hypothetical protein GCM10010245_87320 [Streptomyces spectabilis]|uniref:Thymidylate kinase n=1 Tax=Streptomyces spectabilis TaxID=68270 RepID=A0A7W8EZ83_STRST|nr:hypothetical protein [Streptomyces spectabilis]MBB5109661.1 thymidylate kinase [Streptomyces spectabilis]GGV55161.1 hypothetical protein GCM10010245_87320 [Streptomyces spectabilis]
MLFLDISPAEAARRTGLRGGSRELHESHAQYERFREHYRTTLREHAADTGVRVQVLPVDGLSKEEVMDGVLHRIHVLV